MDLLIDLQDSPPRRDANSIQTCHAMHLLSNDPIHQVATIAMYPPPDLGSMSYSQRKSATTQQHAKFIVSGKSESISGVVEAVHRELVHDSTNCSVELQSTPAGSYLRIIAPKKDDAYKLVETAQTRSRDLVTDQPDTTKSLHVEPPSNVKNGFQIELHVNDVTGEARPYLKRQDDHIAGLKHDDDTREYTGGISHALVDALRKEGRFHTSLTLRIHLGHYVLKRYPRGSHSYDYGQFETMVKNPRALGRFKTQIGDRTLAKATLDFIREGSSPFVPMDSQIPSAAHVVPDYVFEAYSDDAKFEATLAVMNNSKHSAESSRDKVVYYQLSRARVYPRDARIAELNVTNISLGKNLDWKLEAICEDQDEKKFQSVHHYFQSATIQMEGLQSDFDAYPKISLARHHVLASYFKTVAIKSAYRFSWKATGYTVEIAINRRWNGIRELADRREPSIDFSLSIYGESWDEDIRLANEETVGNIWGGDLEFLFRDEGNGEVLGLPDRVRKFLGIVRDIRDAFEGIEDYARPSP
ncbi:hypothetical protein F5X99DRAFT_422874 [Biscogniauxia marginata]|nr:hypothetical protein F5X99DRAFT_422874 [Biscogniauxia marginata]